MNQKIIKLFAKVTATAVFAILFAVNATALVDNNGTDLSFNRLFTTASADVEETGGGSHPTVCGKDECTVTLGIGGTGQSANGHYYHCQTTTTAGSSCSSSSCNVKCDAVIIL